MRSRRASHGGAPPLNCSVRRHDDRIMDYAAAMEDDVLPDMWKQVIPYDQCKGDQRSLDVEFLHLYISDPKRERNFWVEQLPRLARLRFLEVKSRPNQELFEAI